MTEENIKIVSPDESDIKVGDTVRVVVQGEGNKGDPLAYISGTMTIIHSDDESNVPSFGDTIEDENDVHIVLTGGEPTLPAHQSSFSSYVSEIDETPFVEVETNGTQTVQDEFGSIVDQFNVSVKLSNSGHDKERRINEEAILQYIRMGSSRAVFKFVVASEEDFNEVQELVDEFSIPASQVSLMPAGQRQEQLAQTYPKIAELCKKNGYKFSPRLHVSIWNSATGV